MSAKTFGSPLPFGALELLYQTIVAPHLVFHFLMEITKINIDMVFTWVIADYSQITLNAPRNAGTGQQSWGNFVCW